MTSKNQKRILDLPRELRDQIYRELLLADKARNNETDKYALEPAILRANKQIHEECSQVLYKENTLVLITTNWPYLVTTYLEAEHLVVSFTLSGQLNSFLHHPALQIDLRHRTYGTRSTQASMLLDAHNLQHIFRDLTIRNMQPHIEVRVQFDPRASAKPEVREDLLHYLRDIRGVANATITGMKSTSTANELAALMTAFGNNLHEHFEQADTYKTRGDRQLALGHIVDACQIYYGGVQYLDWVHNSRLLHYDVQAVTELTCRQSAFFFDTAACFVQQGKLDNALYMFHEITGEKPHLPDSELAKAHYHSGLVFLKQGKETRALKRFTQALEAQPGHEGAREEIDKIESSARLMDLYEKDPSI